MQNYVVLFRSEDQPPADPPLAFQCFADNMEHAEEQCENAYPGCDILWVWAGDYGVGTDPAYAEYFSVDW